MNRILKNKNECNNLILCSAFLILFFLKGMVYLSILPPFEGWDEYQHVSYLTYLEKTGDRPVLNESKVSRDLIKELVRYPAPDPMVSQLYSTGITGYKTFFDPEFEGPQYNQNHNDIGIYQAQHGKIYYLLVLPLFTKISDRYDLLDLVSILRFINLLFALSTMVIILWTIDQLFIYRNMSAAVSLLVVSQPFLILNSCRVANDSFAILTGTIVISIGLIPRLRKKYTFVILVGFFTGISCWAKSISAILFPFWFFCLFFSWINKDITFKNMCIFLFVSYSISLAILSQYFLFNISHYDMFFVIQESIVNKNNNKTFFDIINAQPILVLLKDILLKWSEESIWHGGWSYLRVRDVRNIVKVLMIFCLLGWAYHFFRRKRATVISLQSLVLCLCLVLLTSLALSWHSLQSALAWGYSSTNPWYICISLPFFLILLASSAYNWSDKVGFLTIFSLSLVYMYSDLRGMITMIHYYSGGQSGIKALHNISSVHPDWLGTPALLGAITLLLLLMTASLYKVAKWNAHLFTQNS